MSTDNNTNTDPKENVTSQHAKSHNVADKLLNSNNIVFTFLRSIVSSQAASWVDMGLSFALFAWIHLAPWLSTAIGAVCGGVVNCIINYRFTFHASGCPWKAVAVKYFMIWTGSLLLNSGGTQLLYHLFTQLPWLEEIGFRPDGYFAAARLLTSLLVSWCWNFVMQRNFVYRNRAFDRYAIKFIDAISFRHNK